MKHKNGRPLLPEHLKKTKQIKINLTESELKRFNSRKLRLLEYSPTLSANDLLRLVVNNIDDFAMVEFIQLDSMHPIKQSLLNNFLLTHVKTENEKRKTEN